MPRTYKRPLFSKRHYEFFAELLRTEGLPLHCLYAEDFVTAFKKDNPQFDADRFRQAIYRSKVKR